MSQSRIGVLPDTVASTRPSPLKAISANGVITNNGALIVNRSNAFSTSQQITGTGSFQQAGAGTTTLSATNNDYTGATTVSNGELRAIGLSGTSAVTVGETGGTAHGHHDECGLHQGAASSLPA